MKYVVLLRGINVGGKNKLPMAELKKCLTELGFSNVTTYIASGNVFLESDKKPIEISTLIEEILPKRFKLDSELIKVLVLTPKQVKEVVEKVPTGFGKEPKKYRYDVLFIMPPLTTTKAMLSVELKDGVDDAWADRYQFISAGLKQSFKNRWQTRIQINDYKKLEYNTKNRYTY